MRSSEILRILPDRMAETVKKAGPDWDRVEEIRIRTEKPVLFYIDSREYFLDRSGVFRQYGKGNSYCADRSEIKTIIEKITACSLYAYQEELRQGFFTLEGGHRIGVAGKIVSEGGRVKTIRYISSLNIRVSHERKGCGQTVLSEISEGGKLYHTLIISPPGCGKTTLLRDLIRMISDGEGISPQTVGVVDERGEIGASVCGVPSDDLGIRTDLLDGCPKTEGIFMLLRSMAPDVIAVDEIGKKEDFEAISEAVNSGCTILATAHGRSLGEVRERKEFASFLEKDIFTYYVRLSERKGKGTGTVEEIRKAERGEHR